MVLKYLVTLGISVGRIVRQELVMKLMKEKPDYWAENMSTAIN